MRANAIHIGLMLAALVAADAAFAQSQSDAQPSSRSRPHPLCGGIRPVRLEAHSRNTKLAARLSVPVAAAEDA